MHVHQKVLVCPDASLHTDPPLPLPCTAQQLSTRGPDSLCSRLTTALLMSEATLRLTVSSDGQLDSHTSCSVSQQNS